MERAEPSPVRFAVKDKTILPIGINEILEE